MSGKDESKAKNERECFAEFLKIVGWPVDFVSFESRNAPAPDILCTLNGKSVAFELLSVTQGEFLQPLTNAQIIYPDETTLKRNLLKKLRTEYESNFPIELLIYYRNSMATNDLNLIDTQEVLWNNSYDQFRRIWYLGESNRLFLFHKNWWSEIFAPKFHEFDFSAS
jgi:hypothetical protein